jgi:hypothetical protein
MANALEQLQGLVKALEAGGYDAAPGTLVQGSALQTEDLSPVMNNVTFDDSHIKLQKMIKVTPAKSTLVQFDRQLSYGGFGGTAMIEGAVGQEFTDDYVRIVVPMCYYSHVRRVTLVANMVNTLDGKDASERAAASAAKKIAADIEFHLFRGKEAFTNSGIFDGNPLVIPPIPDMLGLGEQIRQSDSQRQARDLMFGEYGSDSTVVISGGGYTASTTAGDQGQLYGGAGILTQANIEDSATRSTMNMGNADRLVVDPIVLSAYNKLAFGRERIILAGSPQDATGADLRRQWVQGGVVQVEASRFLSGKTRPQGTRPGAPAAPSVSAADYSGTNAGTLPTTTYYAYYITGVNEIGESTGTAFVEAQTSTATGSIRLTITNPSSAKYFNVYRTAAGGRSASATVAQAKWIGRVICDAATCYFLDKGYKLPGFVTGYLLQGDTMEARELAPYSRVKLAVTDLSIPEAHFRFMTLTVTQPRKNVLIDNLVGSL